MEESGEEYLWYAILTSNQMETYSQNSGQVLSGGTTMPTGHRPSGECKMRHAVAMWQHCKWNVDHNDHADAAGAYLLVWKQSPAQILLLGMLAHTNPTIYYRNAEDLSR
eukprot:6468607-Amphidinium_carterae.1